MIVFSACGIGLQGLLCVNDPSLHSAKSKRVWLLLSFTQGFQRDFPLAR